MYIVMYAKFSEPPLSQYLNCVSYLFCNAVVCDSALLEGILRMSSGVGP